MPLNDRYPIGVVLDAAREYAAIKGRRVTFEYACIAGVNDDPEQAEELAHRLVGLRGGAHVNLIPLNPTPGWPTRGSSTATVHEFRDLLTSLGVNATVRRNRGTDIDATCGQLAATAVTISSAPSPSDRG